MFGGVVFVGGFFASLLCPLNQKRFCWNRGRSGQCFQLSQSRSQRERERERERERGGGPGVTGVKEEQKVIKRRTDKKRLEKETNPAQRTSSSHLQCVAQAPHPLLSLRPSNSSRAFFVPSVAVSPDFFLGFIVFSLSVSRVCVFVCGRGGGRGCGQVWKEYSLVQPRQGRGGRLLANGYN